MKICKNCNKEFKLKSSAEKYCCPSCKDTADRQKKQENNKNYVKRKNYRIESRLHLNPIKGDINSG